MVTESTFLLSYILQSIIRQYRRRKTFRGGLARKRADSARFRADPPDFRQKKFPANSAERPPNVRRTPPNSARIRANPRGLRRELAELFARKMSARKNFPKNTVRRGRTSAADVLPPRTIPPRTIPPRTSAAEERSRI